MRFHVVAAAAVCLAFTLAARVLPAQPLRPFAIEVVDAQTGRGVPLVELTTVDGQRFVTDSSGLAALVEPDLFGRDVYFHVRSHGYEFPADGFGFRGKALAVRPGETARLEVKRNNIAERLYRVTGSGIYRDTLLAGREPPIRQPRTAPQVVGCDSTLCVVYGGRIHWFWGDTSRMTYPLGNFHMTGATSRLPDRGGLDPAVSVELDYFADDQGFVRPMAKMPGEGPTWLGALAVLPDAEGRERMVAHWVKIRGALEVYRWGMCAWNDERRQFEHVRDFDGLPPAGHGQDHTFRHTEPDGTEYLYFANPLPLVRVRADWESYADPRRYERWTCLESGTRFADRRLDRDARGGVRFGWKTGTPLVSQQEQQALVREGRMRSDEAWVRLRDVDGGREVTAHRGSVYFNALRKRWIALFGQQGGDSSYLGEIWYAEADQPAGPWVYARKIVTHERYSFYNPKHHPFFDQQDGRVIYFEGTYTNSFSGNPDRTPRYDYNQVMYRLDLDDARLRLPVAVYAADEQPAADSFTTGAAGRGAIAMFALDRPRPDCVALAAVESQGQRVLRCVEPGEAAACGEAVRFYALPADVADPPAATTPLYEFVHEPSGRRAYSTDREAAWPGYRRVERPLCRVWRP